MSLADRLRARRDRSVGDADAARDGAPPRRRRARRTADPFADLKRAVHQTLLDNLGPKLYDSRLTAGRARAEGPSDAAGGAGAGGDPADRRRPRADRPGDRRRHPRLRAAGAVPARPGHHRDHGQRLRRDLHRARRPDRTRSTAAFTDEAHLRRTIDKIVARVGRRVDESSARWSTPGCPTAAASTPSSRRSRSTARLLTIRKFAADPYRVEDLIGFGTLTTHGRRLPRRSACAASSTSWSPAAPAPGKTTTLNVLSSFIPDDERIITIEDAAELQLHQEHVLRLESRPPNIEGKGEVTIRDLVRNSLRMRPDRIVVGEVRDAAALDMLQAMNTGHDGSICTVHANAPRDALARVETMVLMAGVDLPMRAIREQVSSAIDLIVHQSRFKDGTRHITHITEVVGMEGDVITLQDIFLFDHQAGLRRRRHAARHAEVHRAAPQVPRQARRVRRPRSTRRCSPSRSSDDRCSGRVDVAGRRRRIVGAAAVALALVAAGAGVRRHAAGSTRSTPNGGGRVDRACSAPTGWPRGTTIDPTVGDRPHRRAGGARHRRAARRHRRQACARAAMLAIDTSGSMRTDGGLAGAKSAAAAYLDSGACGRRGRARHVRRHAARGQPADDRPGSGAGRRRQARERVGRTALYDGVVAGDLRAGHHRVALDRAAVRRQGHGQHGDARQCRGRR